MAATRPGVTVCHASIIAGNLDRGGDSAYAPRSGRVSCDTSYRLASLAALHAPPKLPKSTQDHAVPNIVGALVNVAEDEPGRDALIASNAIRGNGVLVNSRRTCMAANSSAAASVLPRKPTILHTPKRVFANAVCIAPRKTISSQTGPSVTTIASCKRYA